ncbi:MAG: SDR family oxidoreductase [Pseudomonadota bacterium]|nr:SDR family oxidoreductase [Pseudomonadota bacterium]
MDLGLSGQNVLITGASKGIGLAAAHAFAREGCALHLAARSAELLADAKRAIESEHGVSVSVHAMDLSSDAAMRALADAVGDVDVLVNNVGDIPSGPLEAVDDTAWRRGFDLKVFGYISVTRAYWERMRTRRSGVIVNDIGNGGETFDARYIAGVAGNASLMAFTRALGSVSLDSGVRVVGVNPGPVATERLVRMMRRRALDLLGDEELWHELVATLPGGRPTQPEEVADLLVFLASPRAGAISGTIVTIDGGLASRRGQ